MAQDIDSAGSSRRLLPFLRTLAIALGIVLVLFAMYEAVERVWLHDVDMETLHILHRIRGLLAALVAASFVGWFIIRKSQPLLTSALAPGEWATGARPRETERTLVYARWFIQMRWIAVVVAFTLIVVTVQVVELLPLVVWWPLIMTVIVLVLLNLVYTELARQKRTNKRLLAFQAYADLLILTVLLHFSGSLENPLAPLMLFHVIIAGIILSRRQCYAVAIVGGAFFAILATLELTGVVHHYTLGIFPHIEDGGHLTHAAQEPMYVVSQVVLHVTILLLTAFFVTTLSDRLRRDERQLERYAERISTERQLLSQALDTTGTALCVCDHNLVPTWNNRQWNTWFGNVPIDSTIHREIYGAKSPARQTMEDGQVRVFEMPFEEQAPAEGAGDPGRTLLTTTAPLMNQDGEINRVVQLAQDITEQKRTQAALIRADKLAAVGEMAGEVAHEINNPIAIISAKARLLLANHRSDISDTVAEELAKVTDMADRIARITQGMLSYSRPSAATRFELDARMPVRKALMLIEQRARNNNVQINDRLPDRALDVMANADELEQVFLNIFLNSMDAMPEGGSLDVSASSVADQHEIVVEDTGWGVDDEIQERVFDPFFTTKVEGEGTGLGLSICVGLVRSHGGTIELWSEKGRGTRTTVTLPVHVSVEVNKQYG